MGILRSLKCMGKRAILMFAAVSLLSIAIIGLCMPSSALAVPQKGSAQEYTYTVRIFAGQQGSFSGQNHVVVTTDAKPGERVSFNQGSVTLNDDSKYYIRGVKLAGRDNDTALATPSFLVNGDVDLVVSYGVLGENVAYTVRYVDTQGNELAPTETFYGNVGDSPVIAYRYIEGYVPQAYNLTGELRPDASSNIYTFTYDVAGGANAPATIVTVDEGTNPGIGENAVATVDAGAAIGDDANPLANPDELENIRDDENPLGFIGDLIRDEALFLIDHAGLSLAMGLAAVALLIAAIWFLRRNRRRDATN